MPYFTNSWSTKPLLIRFMLNAATKNTINLYNAIRLHLSLNYKIPKMAYK